MARRRAGLTDADVMRGGPIPPDGATGGDPPPNDSSNDPPVPKMVKVKVGNLEVEVPEEAAAALESERTAAQTAIQAREELLAAASRTPAPRPDPQPPSGAKDPEEELDELMYTNPREYRKRLKEQVTGELEARYSVAETTRSFWEWFWQVNPTLKRGEHDIVADALFNRNLKQLQNIPLRDAAVKLGVMVKDYLKSLTGEAPPEPGKPRQPNRSSTLEGASHTERPIRKAADEDEPSLGELVKARQNRMRSGGSRTQAS